MSVSKLIQNLEDMPPHEPLDWVAFSAHLNEEFAASTTSEQRGDLLAARAVAMELVTRQLELHGEDLEKFTDACELDYKRLIVQETLVDGVVSHEAMLHVTDREIAAGRMSDDYALRAIAVEESAQPSPTAVGKPSESPASVDGLTKLKRWLHIE